MSGLCVIDYGIGNIRSVTNALGRAGLDPVTARTGDELRRQDPDRIVMPGVGAIGAALRNLREREFDNALDELVIGRCTPFLGICVGMQVLGETCEEFGEHRGLGWIPGRVRHLSIRAPGLPVPHLGWNTLEPVRDDPLLPDGTGGHFYFVHSYFLDCPQEFIVAKGSYGEGFPAIVRHAHICAVQFHPEKSAGRGEHLLVAFARGANPC